MAAIIKFCYLWLQFQLATWRRRRSRDVTWRHRRHVIGPDEIETKMFEGERQNCAVHSSNCDVAEPDECREEEEVGSSATRTDRGQSSLSGRQRPPQERHNICSMKAAEIGCPPWQGNKRTRKPRKTIDDRRRGAFISRPSEGRIDPYKWISPVG